MLKLYSYFEVGETLTSTLEQSFSPGVGVYLNKVNIVYKQCLRLPCLLFVYGPGREPLIVYLFTYLYKRLPLFTSLAVLRCTPFRSVPGQSMQSANECVSCVHIPTPLSMPPRLHSQANQQGWECKAWAFLEEWVALWSPIPMHQ